MASLEGVERHVAGALERAGFSRTGTTLVVATSGGPDSSALLHALHRLAPSHGLSLHVAHLNHNFRGDEADGDARFVEELSQSLGLPVTVEKRDPHEHMQRHAISSFEQAAREMRYSFLASLAEKIGASGVALGHTSDDQAETVLLHIIRGSGLRGLTGMAEDAPWPWPDVVPGLRMFRPLLDVTKADTSQYCVLVGCAYRTDSGNYLHRFTRNRVRMDLMPFLASEYNPQIRDALVRLARTSSMELDYLESELSTSWDQVALPEQGRIRFRRRQLVSLHPLMLRLIMRRAYVALRGNARQLSERNLRGMEDVATGSGQSRTLALPGGLKLHRAYAQLELSTDAELSCPYPPLDGELTLKVPSSPNGESSGDIGSWRVRLHSVSPDYQLEVAEDSEHPESWDAGKDREWTVLLDKQALGDELTVRAWQPGDRFQPLGMAGVKKLQDFFTDSRVPRTWRRRIPLLAARRGIAWVAGHRIADWAKVGRDGSAGRALMLVSIRVKL